VAVPDARAVVARLAEPGILVSARGRGVPVSLHVFHNFQDIDRLLAGLADI
jgi:selenocysteine lyase/cysteine desulfurase